MWFIATEVIGFESSVLDGPPAVRGNSMKKALRRKVEEDMLPEYDFSKAVRGKYYGRTGKRTRVSAVSRRAPAKAARSSRLAASKAR